MEKLAVFVANGHQKRGIPGSARRDHRFPLRAIHTTIDASYSMRTDMIWACLLIAIILGQSVTSPATLAAANESGERAWKIYTNARFGFSVRYPEPWRLGTPLPDGIGVTLHPPIDNSLVTLSGHMNILEGTSQDKRQTLDEFAAAHRRIITEHFDTMIGRNNPDRGFIGEREPDPMSPGPDEY